MNGASETLLGGRLNWGARAAWLVGAMPELIKSFVWDAFVLFYYTQVLGVSSGLNVALVLILVVDALSDPLAGAISDRLRNVPFGRRHSMMLAAIAPYSLGLYFVFSPPAGLSENGLLGWLVVFGILARTGISFYSVPAFALGAELSRNTQERALLATLRNMGNQFALILLPYLAFSHFFVSTPDYPKGQFNPAPYPHFALTAVLISVICMLAVVAGTRKRAREIESLERTAETAQKEPLNPLSIIPKLIGAIRITPNIGFLLALTVLVLVVNSTVSQLTLHLATYYWRIDTDTIRNLQFAAPISALVSFLLAPIAMRRFSPRQLMLTGLLGFFLFQLMPTLLPLVGLAPPPGSPELGWLIVALRMLAGLAYGFYVVPFNAVIFDIGDEHEAATGQPQQGLIGGVMFIGLRAGSAFTAFLAASLLDFINFPANVPVEQMPQNAINDLAIFVCVIIVAAAALIASVIRRFKISTDHQAEIVRRLERMRG